MRAILSPFGFAVHDLYVVERAKRGAKSATDALVRGIKSVRFDDKLEKYRIDARRHKAVVHVVSRLFKSHAALYIFDCFFDLRLGFSDDFLRLVGLWSIEKRNVIFGHHDLGNSHVF